MSRVRCLAPQEREALIWAARGATAAETATALGISINTLNDALKRARSAMGARNTLHAAVLAVIQREIEPEDVTTPLKRGTH